MTTLPAGLDLDMLAMDLARTISDYGYPVDVHEGHLRPHLEAFVTAALATAEADTETDSGTDAATWSPPAAAAPELPVIQRGRRPRMNHFHWMRSQTVDIGTCVDDDGKMGHYWSCPKCPAWAGPYDSMVGEPEGCKRTGMDHVFKEHDLPAARAAQYRRDERAAHRENDRRNGRTSC